jgi:hypothetical protein
MARVLAEGRIRSAVALVVERLSLIKFSLHSLEGRPGLVVMHLRPIRRILWRDAAYVELPVISAATAAAGPRHHHGLSGQMEVHRRGFQS